MEGTRKHQYGSVELGPKLASEEIEFGDDVLEFYSDCISVAIAGQSLSSTQRNL